MVGMSPDWSALQEDPAADLHDAVYSVYMSKKTRRKYVTQFSVPAPPGDLFPHSTEH